MTKNVVYATDENYWVPLYASLHSLLVNNEDSTFRVFVLSKDRNEEFFEYVDELHAVHPDHSIEYVEVSDSDFATAPEPKWFNEGIYYRLLVGSLLPLEDENVLYIDCDTIVDDSIEGLFDVDMDEYVSTGTPETTNKSYWFGLPVDARFYNTGVMYINLENWKKFDVEARSLEYLESADHLQLPLQQILNAVLYEDDAWKPAGPEYNAMVGSWIDSSYSERFERDVDPKIVHYFGTPKPWEYMHQSSYREVWWNYLEDTPYRGYEPRGKDWRAKIVKSLSSTLESYPLTYSVVSNIYKKFNSV